MDFSVVTTFLRSIRSVNFARFLRCFFSLKRKCFCRCYYVHFCLLV